MNKAFTLMELLCCVVLLSILCFSLFGLAALIVEHFEVRKVPPVVATITAKGEVIITQGTNVLSKTP